ncbi:HNH endonuclease signature motif containing protein [Arthrobacter globiformis]|nr:HNH endonuclease signature motif containing protein [Arthrobacter globiformis]
MDAKAAVQTVKGIGSSVAVLAVFVHEAAGAVAGSVSVTGSGGLTVADPLRDEADAWLDVLAGTARLEARVAALKVQAAAGFAAAAAAWAAPDASVSERDALEMSVTAEVACALTVSEGAAARFLEESARLSTDLPLTLAALGAGTLSWQHGRIMCDETEGLSPEAAAALEAHFLDPDAPNPARGCAAGELTPARFRAKARYWRERHHPVSIEKRHHKCVTDRRLEYAPDRDGMAWLSAYLPADQAAGIWDRATAAARALQGPTEPRTLTQLRVDAFASWLLGPAPGVGGAAGDRVAGTFPEDAALRGKPLSTVPPPADIRPAGFEPAGAAGAVLTGAADAVSGAPGLAGDVPSPRAQVLVTVPVFSLLGQTQEPAVLDGYGPIPPSMARRLVADGGTSFLRVLTDPRDGAPLEIGHTSYRLTKPMRHWLRLRDAHCTFPNCNNHSLDNDADHILAWANGGTTGITNLGQPCPKHHRLKHTSAWRPVGATRESPPGWISPSGRCYASEQQDWEPPHWPEPPPGQEWQGLPDWFDQGPEPPEPPDDRDGVGSQMAFDGVEPPLPVDPWPYWSSSTAA